MCRDRVDDSHYCQDSKCDNRVFANKAGLLRHQREVHGYCNNGRLTHLVFCPVPLCVRSKRGFPRRSNLKAHQKRVHPAHLAETTASSPSSSGLSNQESYLPLVPGNAERTEQLATVNRKGFDGNSQMIDLQGQLAVLKRQRTQKDEERRMLDENITVLEKAMQITNQLPG